MTHVEVAHDLVFDFESAVDEELDGLIEDETLESLERHGQHLRSAIAATLADESNRGAAVAFGLMGMAYAIRATHASESWYVRDGRDTLWICEHDPKCAELGTECGPSCICGWC